jgi:hypothetical protein
MGKSVGSEWVVRLGNSCATGRNGRGRGGVPSKTRKLQSLDKLQEVPKI